MSNRLLCPTIIKIYIIFILAICFSACKKLVDIPEPVDSITTKKIFKDDASGNTAVAGMYYKMYNNAFNGIITIYPALTADELNVSAGKEVFYRNNSILSDDDKFWSSLYSVIYSANSVIEGAQASETLSVNARNQYVGEAKFIRAFCFFYLVNLFGDVPLVISTDFASNSLLHRAPPSEVFQQINNDLKEAKSLLSDTYAYGGGERIRANKWAATALLARVYLYFGNWEDAETQATTIIENVAGFNLQGDLNNVFKKNNNEAIFQLQISSGLFATYEGSQFIPQLLTKNYSASVVAQNWQKFVPNYFITNQLLNAFEAQDQRKSKWLDSTGLLNGTNYFYPYKYKIRQGASAVEYVTLLRLAELYLIRAEARALRNNLNGAINDINVIRQRANLPVLLNSLNKDQVLAAIAQENRIEFFLECGHRWFDLKRTAQANTILGPVKGLNWQSTDQYYPIPKSELLLNPNLTQNEGYQ